MAPKKIKETDSKQINRKRLTSNIEGKYKCNSFFSGIGGFDLGFERVGVSPVFHCEINEFCQSILRRHWPSLLTIADINDIKADMLPDAEIWCGGFPCQDVSVARGWLGRDGLKGKNTGLFFPFLELIQKKRPTVVLLENVTGLLNSHAGKDFTIIISSLAKLGYGVAWRVMNARYFGVPQSRPRVFICAWMNRADLALHALYERETNSSLSNTRKGFVHPTKCQMTGASVPLIGYCLSATSGRHTGTDWSRTYVAYYDKVRRLIPVECEQMQGFPQNWSLPEKNYPLNDEEIDSLRYHAIGNAVCVPVVQWIGQRLVSCLSGSYEKLDLNTLSASVAHGILVNNFKDFRAPSPPLIIDDFNNKVSDNHIQKSWKNGGVAYNNWIIDSTVSPAPVSYKETKLIDLLEKNEVESKYFLSPNAATGILRRVDGQNRDLFKPLRKALERLARNNHITQPSYFDNKMVNSFCIGDV